MNTVLVDSSYWIGVARQRRDPVSLLTAASHTRELAICGVVRCEVARGVRVEKDLNRLRNFWDVMINVPTDNAIWEETERLLWRMDRAGCQIPLPDAVIASCARRIDAAVLTFDAHFSQIPGVKVISDPALL